MTASVTIIGNLTNDPELRFVNSGAAVVNFTIASTPRMKDKSGEWVDGETVFLRCTLWRGAAENAAESLRKGTRVIATGRLGSRTWETKEGDKRTDLTLEVDELGPSLKYASAVISKTVQAGGFGQGGGFGNQAPVDDPWATQTKAAPSDEIPF
jgi:single-strand DNA-binding protein